MAKKRRLGQSSSPCSSKMKYDTRGDDVMVARDRLKGALQVLINSDDDSSSSQEEPVPSVSKATPVKKELKSPLIRRRKRKMDVDLELAFHHTFVMKLFDRSVDLAQFKEDTPLYPICRAWIANQPRVPLPYPPLESPEIKREADSLFEFDSEDIIDVHKLPPPSCSSWSSRIPVVPVHTLEGVTLEYSSENLPSADDLLKQHVSRWGNIRRQWIESAQNNESRFQNSELKMHLTHNESEKQKVKSTLNREQLILLDFKNTNY